MTILWADDEIDLLKPHVLFLENKGYQVLTATDGTGALDLLDSNTVDIVFLDENMPGLTGLETLEQLKSKFPSIPVVMITKSEEESIMEEAIGSQISDYLIKPVNPNQILLSVKKNLDHRRLVSEKTTSDYQQNFRQIGMRLQDRLDHKEWSTLYKEMIHWEMALDESQDDGMREVVNMQKQEANSQFAKYIEQNYEDWLQTPDEAPIMSHRAFKEYVAPHINNSQPVFLFMIDNLRFDQWRELRPLISEYLRVESEDNYYAILPTATQYARNAFFAGLMPSDIEKIYPKLWVNEDEEGGKNLHEEELLNHQLKRLNFNIKSSYHKVVTLSFGKKLAERFKSLQNNDLNVIVYNFVDMLSHARTEMEVIRELASDEKAYRSLTLSWFKNSPLNNMLKQAAEMGGKIIITTDHGTMKVSNPSKVVGDRNTNTNLRYKIGKNLDYQERDVLAVRRPESLLLPKLNVSSSYIFAKGDRYFVYPNNYNHFVSYYRDTFQHGGISLEEIIVPMITLNPR